MSYILHVKSHTFLKQAEASWFPWWKIILFRIFALPIEKRYYFKVEIKVWPKEYRVCRGDILVDDRNNQWIITDDRSVDYPCIENLIPLHSWRGSLLFKFYASSQSKTILP